MAIFTFNSDGTIDTESADVQIRASVSTDSFVSYTLPYSAEFEVALSHGGTVNAVIVDIDDTDKVLMDHGSFDSGDHITLIPGGVLKLSSSAAHSVSIDATETDFLRPKRNTDASVAGKSVVIGAA